MSRPLFALQGNRGVRPLSNRRPLHQSGQPTGPAESLTTSVLLQEQLVALSARPGLPAEVVGSKRAISGPTRGPWGASLDCSCPRPLAAAHLADRATLRTRG